MPTMFLIAATIGIVLIIAPFAFVAVLDHLGKKQASKVIKWMALANYCFAVSIAFFSDSGLGFVLAILPPIAGLEYGFFLLDNFLGIGWEGTQACSRGYNCDPR